MFSDKIISNFHNALDSRESDHAMHLLNDWLAGADSMRYLSMRRMRELGVCAEMLAVRHPKFNSAFAVYGGLHIPHERTEAMDTLLEFCRCWPEMSQAIIGLEAETAWKLWCAESV